MQLLFPNKFRFKGRFRDVFKVFNIFSSKHWYQVTHIIFKKYASKCCHYIWEGHIKLVFSTEYPSNIIINVQHTLWSLNDLHSSVTKVWFICHMRCQFYSLNLLWSCTKLWDDWNQYYLFALFRFVANKCFTLHSQNQNLDQFNYCSDLIIGNILYILTLHSLTLLFLVSSQWRMGSSTLES